MTNNPIDLYFDINERLSGAFAINAINENDYNKINNELLILKPYIEFSTYRKVNIKQDILIKRLEGLYDKLKFFILNNKE